MGMRVPQGDGVAWMKAALEKSLPADTVEKQRALRLYDVLLRRAKVEARVTSLEDYSHQDWGRMRLFEAVERHEPVGGETTGARPWYAPPLENRMAFFAKTTRDVAETAFMSDIGAPDLLVQVSCTGYDSPVAVQRVVFDKGWQDSTRVLHIGHMGCYAALPALVTASESVSAMAARRIPAGVARHEPGDALASILLVELCTLHHHPEATDPEQVVQQCLFADGAARVDVTRQRTPGSFALLDHHETIIPDTMDEMTWRVADSAFSMTLSRNVPDHVENHIAPVIRAFLKRNGLEVEEVDLFAVHPGGPRVIESVTEALSLAEPSVRHSHQVLRERGNMSSTTLPHIWAGIASDERVEAGALVCSLAFGPGLTVAVNLSRWTGHGPQTAVG